MWFSESFEVKYNIGFGIPVEFTSQRRKKLKSVQKQRNYALIKSAKIIMLKTDVPVLIIELLCFSQDN